MSLTVCNNFQSYCTIVATRFSGHLAREDCKHSQSTLLQIAIHNEPFQRGSGCIHLGIWFVRPAFAEHGLCQWPCSIFSLSHAREVTKGHVQHDQCAIAQFCET